MAKKGTNLCPMEVKIMAVADKADEVVLLLLSTAPGLRIPEDYLYENDDKETKDF